VSIRLAVIGAGVMGSDHARIIAEDLPGATLQVVCDADGGRARKVADTHGAAHAETDPFATIRRPDVDAVLIASPDPTHAPLCLAAIEAGKPALCEKPLAQSVEECLQVIAAETATGRRFLQFGFMRRFDQSYREMKAALDDGTIGPALMMHNFHRNVETPAADFSADMAITNSAPHEFDVARFVLGQEFQTISAFAPKGVGGKVGPVFMVLETVAGQLVTIEINNNAAYGYDVRGELVGAKGAISLNAPSYTRLDAGLTSRTAYAPDWRPRYGEAYRRQDKAFLDFVRTGEFPAIAADTWDGYSATLVAQAGVRALKVGHKVEVGTSPRPALYAMGEAQ
jgi:myo-inositol 2-dehydrogenase / D-chiro-inositol 1-dehydrogenase